MQFDISQLKAALRKKNKPISGAALAAIISRDFPQINFREPQLDGSVGTLRSFVERRLSDTLQISGRSGTDLLYSVVGDHSTTANKETEPIAEIWKEFVSPAGRRTLAVLPPTWEVHTLEHEATNPAHVIQRVSRQELAEIAHQFAAQQLTGISDPDAIRSLRSLADSGQYGSWLHVLRENAPKKLSAWFEWRRDALFNLFDSRLARIAFPSNSQRVAAMRQMKDAQSLAASTAKNNHRWVDSPIEDSARMPLHQLVAPSLRDCLIAAIETLDEVVLWEMRVPAGAMWEAFCSLTQSQD